MKEHTFPDQQVCFYVTFRVLMWLHWIVGALPFNDVQDSNVSVQQDCLKTDRKFIQITFNDFISLLVISWFKENAWSIQSIDCTDDSFLF